MFSKIWTTKSTGVFSAQAEQLRQLLADADAVVLGAGAGLSTSAGFVYDGARFRQYFADFAAKYGFADMYSGGFYPYATLEEHWAYWSRYIYINRYQNAPKPIYNDLFRLVKDKDYFVLTTNVDHCFQKAGFDKKRLFYTQGDYGLFQCAEPCCPETFDNEALVRRMVEAQGYAIAPDGNLTVPEGVTLKMRIPAELVPPLPALRPAADHESSGGQHLCGGRRLAPRRRAVQRFSAPPRGAENFIFGAGCGLQHPRHHQVSLLAHDRPEPAGVLCLHQSGPGPASAGDRTARAVHPQGYRGGCQRGIRCSPRTRVPH